jgi:hypothetical protein
MSANSGAARYKGSSTIQQKALLCAETVGEVRHPCVPQDFTRQHPKRER